MLSSFLETALQMKGLQCISVCSAVIAVLNGLRPTGEEGPAIGIRPQSGSPAAIPTTSNLVAHWSPMQHNVSVLHVVAPHDARPQKSALYIALFGPHVKIVQLRTSSPFVGDFHFAHRPAMTIWASSAKAMAWGCFS
jgi:hypothetical protein